MRQLIAQGIVLAMVLVFGLQQEAFAAKKKAAPKGKAKVAAAATKKRAPANVSKAKMAVKMQGKKASSKALKGTKAAKVDKKARKPATNPAGNPQRKMEKPASSGSPDSPSKVARVPSGMAGLGLAAGGGMTANKAFEIRGQARTLSMMLILRNGKENINFVKVRQDYASEIARTEF